MSPGHWPFDPWYTAWAYADALAVPRGGAAAWRQRQAERLGALLDDVQRRSALYRRVLQRRGRGPPSLADVPALARGALMRRFDAWVTDPDVTLQAVRAHLADPARRGQPLRGRYAVWCSSGSRGEPGVFVQDAGALAVSDALEAARGPLTLVPAGGLRLAYVGAVDGPFAGITTLQRLGQLAPWFAACARSFSFLQPLCELAAQLDEHQPSVLSTYPSMAWTLAQAQAEGRLHLRLRALWTGGETLTPTLRAALGAAFDAPVHDMYGASECLCLASEGRCGRLHLNADWVVLEPVDAHGRAVPEGVASHTTLLTALANRVQPILRYDLGDRVRVIPGACRCGSALPAIEVEGRCDDMLAFRDARGRPLSLSPLALATVLEDEGGVFDFDLHQARDGALRLTLHGVAAAQRPRAHAALLAWLRGQGVADLRLASRAVRAAGRRGASGKRCRIHRDAPH
ncbi:MAG TPA: AMP-binding protein [Burkholderiaceae bacterium]|nr:AMP-binding protein [Burkholderiaceae bacterium]